MLQSPGAFPDESQVQLKFPLPSFETGVQSSVAFDGDWSWKTTVEALSGPSAEQSVVTFVLNANRFEVL